MKLPETCIPMRVKGVPKTVRNGILDYLLQLYQEEKKKEVKEAPLVTVMTDDTTDISEHTQMVIVLRYVLNAETFERFGGFFIPEN